MPAINQTTLVKEPVASRVTKSPELSGYTWNFVVVSPNNRRSVSSGYVSNFILVAANNQRSVLSGQVCNFVIISPNIIRSVSSGNVWNFVILSAKIQHPVFCIRTSLELYRCLSKYSTFSFIWTYLEIYRCHYKCPVSCLARTCL